MSVKKYLSLERLTEYDALIKAEIAEVDEKFSEKANATHSHAISDVTNLQSTLNGKVPTSRTVNGKALSANITLSASDVGADASGAASGALESAKAYTDEKIDAIMGEGAAETLDTIGEISDALKDNAGIIDTLATKTSLDSHTDNTTVHITSAERTNWDAAKSHADSAHAPSNAEKNQNAFSNVVVGSTTVSADTATDSLTLVAGTNVTITADATNDKITISAKDTVVTVDSALSNTSTNPVQNKVINSAFVTLTETVQTNIDTISGHTTAIGNLQTAVSEIQEITSAEIEALFNA